MPTPTPAIFVAPAPTPTAPPALSESSPFKIGEQLNYQVFLGANRLNSRDLVQDQVPGTALRISARDFMEESRDGKPLRPIVERYVQAYLRQVSQQVACNGLHSVQERCARWILLTHDRVGADEFPLTQEFLSQMLGVRRASVTVAAGALFGSVVGVVVVSLASTTGAALAFLVARYLARDAVLRWVRRNPRYDAIDRAIGEGGWRVVALLRLSPLVPFNLQNYLYGLTAIRFWPCVLTSWAAMLPGTVVYVYLGHAGRG